MGAGYARQMQTIAVEFGDGIVRALNAPYKVYEVAKYVESLPVEKREGG